MKLAELKRARGNYLFSCGLALVAAVLGIANPDTANADESQLRLELIFVSLAALGMFAWIVARTRNSSDAEVPEMSRSVSRLRRISLLWLALAAVLGGSLMRAPAGFLLGETTPRLSEIHWISCALGLAIIAIAIWRFITALTTQVKHD